MYLIVIINKYRINFNGANMSEETEWKSKIIDKGTTTVKYCISKRIDEKGKNAPLIQDITKSIISGISLEKCIALMKDIPKHKYFTGDYISKLVKTISENEWIIYYYTKNPLFIGNSDCVCKMLFEEDKDQKIVKFTLEATPSAYKHENVKRMDYYNVAYMFKEIENGKIEITLTGKSTPPVKVPIFVIKSAFPGVPLNAVKKIIALLKE
jgi:hypothetical protein